MIEAREEQRSSPNSTERTAEEAARCNDLARRNCASASIETCPHLVQEILRRQRAESRLAAMQAALELCADILERIAEPARVDANESLQHLWAHAIAAARGARAALQKDGGGWQPIDTAPKDVGTSVLLATAEGAVLEGYFDPDGERWFEANTHSTDYYDGQIYNPTHWMPMPLAPRIHQQSTPGEVK